MFSHLKSLSCNELTSKLLTAGLDAAIVDQLRNFLTSIMVNCVACKCWVSGGIDAFKQHLKSVLHSAPYICYEGDCFSVKGRSYGVRSSFIRHLYMHHNYLNSVSSDSSNGSSDNSNSDSGDDGNTNNGEQEDETSMDYEEEQDDMEERMEYVAARLLLNLTKKGNVVGKAIDEVIEETVQMIRDIVAATLEKVVQKLKRTKIGDENIYEEIKSIKINNPFRDLKNPEKRLICFSNKFNMVLPQSKFIDFRWDERVERRSRLTIPVQVPMYFQYISLMDTLVAVLNNPICYDLIHNEKRSTDGRMRSYLDGEVAQTHPLISKYPYTLRLVKWMDDSEVVNAQGSKTSIHKIVSDCFQIQNLPPEENARLRSIFLSSYAYREDLPADEKVDILLEPFQKELEKLESEEGVLVNVRGEQYRLRAAVVGGAADTLAGHEMCGLASPSANRFCSQCLVSRHEFKENILAMGVLRTRDVHMKNIEELQLRGRKFAMTSSGVDRLSRLCRSKFTDFPEAMIKDPMHDILRGIAPMEIKLVLNHYINDLKLFDAIDFNARMKSFNYGYGDSKNKPSPNFTKKSFEQPLSYTLHQTAAQAWCLLRVFPFLVADLVPEDDSHLNLIVLLKRMSDVMFSLDISESDIDLLESLTEEHHLLFEVLFPPPNSSAPQVVEEINEENDEDDLNEDFLEEPLEDQEEYIDDPAVQQPSAAEAVASTSGPMNTGKKKRKRKVIRALQKHHHVLHAARSIRKYGPIALYSTMRFEGKNALPKRFAAICNNFKNLPVTFANLHQVASAAGLLDMVTPVKEEKSYPRGKLKIAGDLPFFNDIVEDLGIEGDSVVQCVQSAQVGGFHFEIGCYLVLPVIMQHPLFGLVTQIFVFNNQIYVVTKDIGSFYDKRFGAYMVQDTPDPTVRVFSTSRLPSVRPITAWTADSLHYYLSLRTTIPIDFCQ